MILKEVLKTKTVSVWGLGYLGYTTILKLQESGFHILVYDLHAKNMKLLAGGRYPNQELVAAWTQTGYLPRLDMTKIRIARSQSELFKSSHLHIIATPEDFKKRRGYVEQFAEIFSWHLKKNRIKPLIMFESASVPGHIERNFVRKLKAKRLSCGRDYFLGAWFRTDWTVEAFIHQRDKMPIAGYCGKSMQEMRDFFRYLDVPTVELDGLKDAEVYINSVNTIQAMANDFVRQLSLGYPSINMKRLSRRLFENISLGDCGLNMGTGGMKMTSAIDYLVEGSETSGSLTLLREFQDINISSVLTYAEYIKRHSYDSVAILGLTYKGNQKDLTLSPAITLANFLIKNSIQVTLNDPLFSKREIRNLVPGARISDFPGKLFSYDVIVLSSDHNEYRYLSQDALDGICNKKTKLIIDNYGIWSHLSFGSRTRYHQVGDGSLNLLK